MAKNDLQLGAGQVSEALDLQSQLEALLDQVWKSEAEWRLDDRIAQAVRASR